MPLGRTYGSGGGLVVKIQHCENCGYEVEVMGRMCEVVVPGNINTGWQLLILLPHHTTLVAVESVGTEPVFKECYIEDYNHSQTYRWDSKEEALKWLASKWNFS
jgi:hypothetical protein